MDLLASRPFAGVAREPSTSPQVVEALKRDQTKDADQKTHVCNSMAVIQGKFDLKREAAPNKGTTKDTLILHRLGSCFRVPDLDYLRFRFMGSEMPPRSEIQQICRPCVKAGALDQAEGGSSNTQTSSSTDEE